MTLYLNGTTGISGVDGSAGTPAVQGTDTNTGISFPAADTIAFNEGGAEVGRFDSSGRLLVGTSSGSSNGTLFALMPDNTNGTGIVVRARNSGGTASQPAVVFEKSDTTVNSAIISDIGTGYLAFNQGGSERVRITNFGKALINRTSAGAGSTAGLEMQGSANDTNYTFAVYDATGSDRVISVRNDNYLVSTTTYGRTTAGAANINIDSAGFMARSTSSIKYKTDVETIQADYSEAILGCRPVWYRSKSERDNPQWGWWGFIAEEVAEIDPRLVQWRTTKTEIGENGELQDVVLDQPEPEGVQYDRFVPHLINLIKRQKEQIEAMEARLTALESA